ncbi:YrrS family protein [Metabacillus malikii]|uniref:Cytoskeletal protein RodZ n=1 Tax=Metabacillus malikii TaxID=1504265 RepID=A0ABT9ZGY6_9BACI|nr:YrrS family protein [Metabacillus malikii]MDQ0231552.1 cytoskeletal protein RodZ [Metabacillus malikii]
MSNYDVHSRFEKRDKRRKTNIVLNTLIGIVVVLIVFIGSQLILGGNDADKTAKYNEQPEIKLANEENTIKEQNEKDTNDNDADTKSESNESDTTEPSDDVVEDETAHNERNLDDDNSEDTTITAGEPGSGVEETIESSGWEPVGTSQSEPHAADYTKGSQDWNEMTRALSYATGIPENDMIIWRLENNGSPNDAVGTISPKDKSAKFKVYITWVENKGWKPTKIEKLN